MARKTELICHPAAAGSASWDDPAIGAAAAEWFARRDAGLSVAQEHVFQQWLAADPRHGTALARLDSAWSTFGRPSRTGAADELIQELADRAARRRRRRLSVTAAALAVVLALGSFWRIPRHEELAPALPATAMILVPTRQVLPDGSVVLLKAGAQIAEAYTADFRRVELKQGEAIFEVAKDHSRPFLVSAGGVEVRAVGTAFSVELAGKSVDVLVTEGTVLVGAGDLPRSTGVRGQTEADTPVSVERPLFSAARVQAGHRIVVDAASSTPQATPVTTTELDERLAWRNRRVEFSGTPLVEAVDLLNREAASSSDVRLGINDPALFSMRVSGIFRTDNMDAFVLLLEAGFGVKAERAGKSITLRKASASPN